MSDARDELIMGDTRTAVRGDGVERFPAPTTLSESVATSEVRPVGLRASVREPDGRVRWSAVLAGATVALATFLLLELALLAIDALDPAVADATSLPDGTWWSVIAGVVAFFLGGIVAGASNPSRRSGDGPLSGIAAWGLGVALLVVLAVAASGLVLGGLGDAIGRLGQDQAATGAVGPDDVDDAAGRAAVMLAAAAIAAAVGGAIGNRMRSRSNHDDTVRLSS